MANVKHKFKYIKVDQTYRPILDITLRNGSSTLKYGVLVDSGADFNIFHIDVASLIGLDLSKAQDVPFGGIKDGAQCMGKLGLFEIGIDGIFFYSWAIFSADISSNGYAIVGQKGFFDNFKSVQFNYSEKKGYLK